ncbi:hypothetical protein GCK72_004032 [Caenorhabditis remanei]|uniref:Uncharacterized protein n=1 Tax=Caenorhabditis remanei TaxID=31234 RepID=A0A6A5HB53_CAERE|nr:hypothetical protein GCK72_004032 [Caenorhabditis remanei]KAF1764086.1 hypothetical protein GCK72_004032 [Caenorhabditis remanei]
MFSHLEIDQYFTGNERKDITMLMDMAIAKHEIYGKLKELPLQKNTLNRQLYHSLWKRLQNCSEKTPESLKRGASEDSEFAPPTAKQAKAYEELGSEAVSGASPGSPFDISLFEKPMLLMDPAEILWQNPGAGTSKTSPIDDGSLEIKEYDAPAANLNPTDLEPIEDFGAWLKEFDEAHGLNEIDVALDNIFFGNPSDNWNDLIDITV